MNKVYLGDNLSILKELEDNSVDLIYIDPPFNTRKLQQRDKIATTRDKNGDRRGFSGNSYSTEILSTSGYNDLFDDYYNFLTNRITELHRILKNNGSFFLHLDYNEVHYMKVLCDWIFGRDHFLNEIIWAYDYGARTTKKWPNKHNNILWYYKGDDYYFNLMECDRIPYMSPDLVGEEKAKNGKTPTSVWWMSIEGTNSHNRVGYATEKPYKLLERIIKVHSKQDDIVLDCFAGSGKIGKICDDLNRRFILVDNNKEAIDIMKNKTLVNIPNIEWIP